MAKKRRKLPMSGRSTPCNDSLVNVEELLTGAMPADDDPTGPMAVVRELRPRSVES